MEVVRELRGSHSREFVDSTTERLLGVDVVLYDRFNVRQETQQAPFTVKFDWGLKCELLLELVPHVDLRRDVEVG